MNCVDYYHGGDKPYLMSGADDRLVKIWDYQNKTCVQTLEGHAQVHFTFYHVTANQNEVFRFWILSDIIKEILIF